MTRIKAALTHLLISSALASVVMCLIVFGWYPLPFFWDIGGPMLLILIVGIDVVLGPLMTMILFNPDKSRRELSLDLTLVGIIQLSAMIYGLHSGYVGRASYGAFHEGQFHLVYAGDLAPKFVAEASQPQFRKVAWIGQQYVGVVVPDTPQNQSDVSFFAALGAGPERFPKFYVPLNEVQALLRQSSLTREQLQKANPALLQKIDALLAAQQLGWTEVAVVPFDLRTATYTAVVDIERNRVVKVLRDDPLHKN